ncbi:MAG: ATP-NAD kinase family protein [Dehalobacterium sp.]
MRKKLGLIVNPLAGVGGRVGLKGSDGEEIQRRALELGARPESPKRTMDALDRLRDIKEDIELITYPAEMGEMEALKCGFEPRVIGMIDPQRTTAQDTINAAREMAQLKVDLLLFAGGDGTARNLHDALDKTEIPVIGIPAGVKIHSAVYATNSKNAGEVALMCLQGKLKKLQEAEVMDIDEEAFRVGRVTAKLYGYLKVPHEERLVQHLKSGRTEGEVAALNSIADEVTEKMQSDVLYVIGPGTTTRAVMEKLALNNTLLGVDVVLNHKVIARDVTEAQLLNLIKGKRTMIIVTVIGGQGYIFGRGNQQLSPKVLQEVGKENIIVIAPQSKISALGQNPLLIDTGDYEVNEMLSGYYKVITGYQKFVMRKAE